MAKIKLKKYPKKPKMSASLSVLQNYLDKVRAIDKENAAIKSENTKRDKLAKVISGLKPGAKRVSSGSTKRRKPAAKKTTTKKRAKKRK